MAQYALLLSVALPQIYLRNNLEDYILSDYLETELNATGEYFANPHKDANALKRRV